MNTTEMKHYKSAEWNFDMDIPKTWHAFPPVCTNSPHEVIRFASKEDGTHLLIIFRAPHDPNTALQQVCEQAQKNLEPHGFANFAVSETTIGHRPAVLLEFDRPQGGGTWSCREYFLIEGTLQYTLGFGTSNRNAVFELYDRMAKSFDCSGE